MRGLDPRELRDPLAILAAALGIVTGMFLMILIKADSGSQPDNPVPTSDSSVVVEDGSNPTPPTPARTETRGPTAAKVESRINQGLSELESSLGLDAETSVVVASPSWNQDMASVEGTREQRLWSLSKPVVGLTVLGRSPAEQPVEQEIDEAISTSSNCSTRALTSLLQEQVGGSPDATVQAFEETLGKARVQLSRGPQITPPDIACPGEPLLGTQTDPEEPSPQFGTSEWMTEDAARFMESLGSGDFGAPGERILTSMRMPKGPSNDPGNPCGGSPGFDWNWGAGNGFPDSQPAFKSGWGWSEATGEWIVSQMAWVEGSEGSYAISVVLGDELGEKSTQCVSAAERKAMDEIFELVKVAVKTPDEGSSPTGTSSEGRSPLPEGSAEVGPKVGVD